MALVNLVLCLHMPHHAGERIPELQTQPSWLFSLWIELGKAPNYVHVHSTSLHVMPLLIVSLEFQNKFMPWAGLSIQRRWMKHSACLHYLLPFPFWGCGFQYSSALLRDSGTSFSIQESSIPHFQEVLCGKGNFQALGSALFICNQMIQAASGKYIVDFREWRGNTCIWLLHSIRKMILLARCRGDLP